MQSTCERPAPLPPACKTANSTIKCRTPRNPTTRPRGSGCVVFFLPASVAKQQAWQEP
jgi:hypothetical protein